MTTPYTPVTCDYHDVLEALATTRKVVSLIYRMEDGTERTSRSRIVDVYSRDGFDFLTLEDGEIVRLDRLVNVDGAAPMFE